MRGRNVESGLCRRSMCLYKLEKHCFQALASEKSRILFSTQYSTLITISRILLVFLYFHLR